MQAGEWPSKSVFINSVCELCNYCYSCIVGLLVHNILYSLFISELNIVVIVVTLHFSRIVIVLM